MGLVQFSDIEQDYRETIRNFVVAAAPMLNDVTKSMSSSPKTNGARKEHNILIEGANALLLDIDHGTYPFVTSSNTGLGGVFTGLGGLSGPALFAPSSNVVGVVKAYTTRVGSGPFPTELDETIKPADAAYGKKLQEVGREWGVTTGRKRRCGWLDLVLVRYSAQVNSYSQINLTKLDILDSFEEIRVATSYRLGEETIEEFPADLDQMERIEIEYKTFQGWQTTTTGCQKYGDLPDKARQYIEYVEQQIQVPIAYIGTGPRREDMIVREFGR